MCFAFARDRGIPAWRLASRIDPRWSTPAMAILITSLLAFLATVYSAAYSVITSMSTTSLYLAYSIPIFLNWRNRRRAQGEFTDPSSAPWNLGRYGPVLNLIAIAWVAFITILFSIPPNELAGLTMAAVLIGLTLYWMLSQRHRFRGPAVSMEKLSGAEADLRSAL
jgi:amino acid transporter